MKIALVGLGEIARSQHIPALEQSGQWQLAATVSRSSAVAGVENFASIEQLLAARPDIPVVSLCVPPAPRFAIARATIHGGRHLMLEKPPGATVGECRILQRLAADTHVTLFATWHSREAAMLDQCQAWLADKRIAAFDIQWKEDVRRWHPGQEWIWEPGGLGVFDPGINALSILTRILPEPVRVTGAVLETPANRQTPIAATLQLATSSGAAGRSVFDWRQQGEQVWEIRVQTDAGELHLAQGGAVVTINGELTTPAQDGAALAGEYPRLYQRMHQLIARQTSDCDLSPLELVADAFMLGRREQVDAFEF